MVSSERNFSRDPRHYVPRILRNFFHEPFINNLEGKFLFTSKGSLKINILFVYDVLTDFVIQYSLYDIFTCSIYALLSSTLFIWVQSRDALDPVRALLNLQALDIMGLDPPEGDFDCRILAQGGGRSIAGFSDFWCEWPEMAPRRRFSKFWWVLKILPNWCTEKSSEIALRSHFERTNFSVRAFEKISNFRLDVQNQHSNVRTPNFELKRATIEPIMHKTQ